VKFIPSIVLVAFQKIAPSHDYADTEGKWWYSSWGIVLLAFGKIALSNDYADTEEKWWYSSWGIVLLAFGKIAPITCLCRHGREMVV
jgi:hypothetical protein